MTEIFISCKRVSFLIKNFFKVECIFKCTWKFQQLVHHTAYICRIYLYYRTYIDVFERGNSAHIFLWNNPWWGISYFWKLSISLCELLYVLFQQSCFFNSRVFATTYWKVFIYLPYIILIYATDLNVVHVFTHRGRQFIHTQSQTQKPHGSSGYINHCPNAYQQCVT